MRVQRLLFVFSADSGKLNAFLDSARKLLRLDGCTLCSITHGLAGERDEWTECKTDLGVPVDYVHRDEMTPDLRQAVGRRLPCVVAETAEGLKMLLEPEVLDRCKDGIEEFERRLFGHAEELGLELPKNET